MKSLSQMEERKGMSTASGGMQTKLLYLLIGGGIGAVAGLLLAPKPGSELRNDISEITRTGYDETLDLAQNVKAHTADLAQNVKAHTADLAQNVKEHSADLAQNLKEHSADLYQTVKEKADRIYGLASEKLSPADVSDENARAVSGEILQLDDKMRSQPKSKSTDIM